MWWHEQAGRWSQGGKRAPQSCWGSQPLGHMHSHAGAASPRVTCTVMLGLPALGSHAQSCWGCQPSGRMHSHAGAASPRVTCKTLTGGTACTWHAGSVHVMVHTTQPWHDKVHSLIMCLGLQEDHVHITIFVLLSFVNTLHCPNPYLDCGRHDKCSRTMMMMVKMV